MNTCMVHHASHPKKEAGSQWKLSNWLLFNQIYKSQGDTKQEKASLLKDIFFSKHIFWPFLINHLNVTSSIWGICVLWHAPYVRLSVKLHRHRPPLIISWCCLLPGVSLVPPGKTTDSVAPKSRPRLLLPFWLPTPVPLPVSAWLHSLNTDNQISQQHNYNRNTAVLENKHSFSILMKRPSNYAHNSVLQPTFKGRAIIIILPWSR